MSEKEDVHSVLDSGMGLSCGPSLNTTTGIEPSLDTASVTPRRQDCGQRGDYSSDAENPDLSFQLSPDVTNSGSPSPASREQSGAATPPGRPMLNTSAKSDGDNELSLNMETPTSATPDLAGETPQPSTRSRTTTDGSEDSSVQNNPQPLCETLLTSVAVATGVGSAAPVLSTAAVATRPFPSGAAGVSVATGAAAAAPGAVAGSAAPGIQRPQSYDERASTFDALGRLEKQLCVAGFYQDDKLYRCHSCPLFIDSEHPDIRLDATWELHAQQSPECEFLRHHRGTDFIQEHSVQYTVDAARKPESVKSSITAGPKDSDHYINQNVEGKLERLQQLFSKIQEDGKESDRKHEQQFNSLHDKVDESERATAQKFYSLQEDIRGVDTQSTLRTETVNRKVDGVRTKIDVMETRQQASDVNARTNEREISDQVDALKLRQHADSCQYIEGQQKLCIDLEEYKKETDGRFQDFAGANNTVVTTQPPPPDVQPEPTTPVTFAVDDGSEADAEVANIQPTPESNPGNR